MNTIGLLKVIKDKDASAKDRIEALEQLDIVRLQEKHVRKEDGLHLGVPHLGKELPGQKELKDIVRSQRDRIDVRCQAAAVLARTDSDSALNWCNEMVRQHLRVRDDGNTYRDSHHNR